MSDRETRMMARMRRADEARRARRDQITTYGLVAVVVTFAGARYAGHRSLERACLALLAAFGLYAVGVALAAVDAGLDEVRRVRELLRVVRDPRRDAAAVAEVHVAERGDRGRAIARRLCAPSPNVGDSARGRQSVDCASSGGDGALFAAAAKQQ